MSVCLCICFFACLSSDLFACLSVSPQSLQQLTYSAKPRSQYFSSEVKLFSLHSRQTEYNKLLRFVVFAKIPRPSNSHLFCVCFVFVLC